MMPLLTELESHFIAQLKNVAPQGRLRLAESRAVICKPPLSRGQFLIMATSQPGFLRRYCDRWETGFLTLYE